MTQDEAVNYESLILQDSESFHGEIHDLRFYLQSINEDKISDICLNTIKNLEEEKTNFNLCFYVPVFYVNDYVFKRSIVNANSTRLNTYFSCIYNPYLSNTCGGLEMSSESFLIDFANLTKPNIVIGGVD